jgi:hypothetical protein
MDQVLIHMWVEQNSRLFFRDLKNGSIKDGLMFAESFL